MTKAAKKPEPMKAITIKANELEAISLAASHEETRYYLCGVNVEIYKDGSYGLMATDGHRLATLNARKDEQPVDSFIIGNNAIKKALTFYKVDVKKIAKSLRDNLVISATQDAITIQMDEMVKGSFAYKPIDGNFPDWRRVYPSGEPQAGAIGFNATYLADFGKMAKLLGSPISCIAITSTGAQNPALITMSHCSEFMGVLMPVRI